MTNFRRAATRWALKRVNLRVAATCKKAIKSNERTLRTLNAIEGILAHQALSADEAVAVNSIIKQFAKDFTNNLELISRVNLEKMNAFDLLDYDARRRQQLRVIDRCASMFERWASSVEHGRRPPPRVGEFLLTICAPPSLRDAVVGDANERFSRDYLKRGAAWATTLYYADVARSVAPLLANAIARLAVLVKLW